MTRYRGPKLRVVRRLGLIPSLTSKVSNKKNFPGEHGSFLRKFSKFNIRLREKQKICFFYGISNSQLLNYLKKAKRKQGSCGKQLLLLLEMRLDVIIYRSGIFPSLLYVRQFICHNKVQVNNRKVTFPGFCCRLNDTIKFSDDIFQLLKEKIQKAFPTYLLFDNSKHELKIINDIELNSLGGFVDELLVVEYYSFVL
jgi:small subunit ribosomal protein S4